MEKREERGSAVVLAGLFTGVMAVAGVVVVQVGSIANSQAKAQTAADAAALAGVQAGEGAARQAAFVNGAELTQSSSESGEFQVEVEIDGRTATARAKLSGGLG